nr:hypothetical protein CFP56_22206 [Quercus suber]
MQLRDIPKLALDEFRITYALIYKNAAASMGLHLAYLLPRLALDAGVTFSPVSLTLEVLGTAFFYAYVFEVANQTMSAEEDKVNRPDRPIPAGLITVEALRLRWIISWTLCPALLSMRSPRAAVFLMCWQGWCFQYYVWPKPDSFWMKNLFTGVGILLELRIVDSVLRLHSSRARLAFVYELAIELWASATIHVQDFPDCGGDRIANRKTLPILFDKGQMAGRLRELTAYLLVAWSAAFLLLLSRHPHSTYEVRLLLGFLQLIGSILTASRLLYLRSKTSDVTTYLVFYQGTGLLLMLYLSSSGLPDRQ